MLRTRVAQDKLEHHSDEAMPKENATHALLYFKSTNQASNGDDPTGTIPITRGVTVVSEVFKKSNRCIRIASPGDARAYFMAPEGGSAVDGAANRA